MAAAVICECCGKVVPANKSLHIRVHKTNEPGRFMTSAEDYFDVCEECYNGRILPVLANKEQKK